MNPQDAPVENDRTGRAEPKRAVKPRPTAIPKATRRFDRDRKPRKSRENQLALVNSAQHYQRRVPLA